MKELPCLFKAKSVPAVSFRRKSDSAADVHFVASHRLCNARGVRTGVAFGNHSVATVLYVEGAGCTYAYYQSDYRVYKP